MILKLKNLNDFFTLDCYPNLELAKRRREYTFHQARIDCNGYSREIDVQEMISNYNVVRYHLLHINFLLIKEDFKHIIIVTCFINKKRKNNIIWSIRPLIGCE